MLLNGKRLGPNVVTLVLPRGEEEPIVIRAQAVLDYDEFNAIFPRPEPPVKIMRGGAKQPDFEAKSFLQEMQDYGLKRTQYMIIKSLSATEGLKWERVKIEDPNTWHDWENELKEAHISDVERQRIMAAVMEANALNEAKLEEARERFLSGKDQKVQSNGSTSQSGEAKTTPSGEVANELTSAHQES